MGSSSGAPPDYQKLQDDLTNAGKAQLGQNRPNTNSPWASQTFNPDGSTSTQLTGGAGQAAAGLNQQAASLGQGMDWSNLGALGQGDAARDQTTNAAYGQASSRLNPLWQRQMDSSRTSLLNSGFDPTSEAYKNQMGDLGRARNDAYGSAMTSAIGQGNSAQDSVFGNNVQSRQQAIAESLGRRNQPLDEMQKLMGLTQQPEYSQDNSTMGAAMGAGQFEQKAYQQKIDEEAARNAALGQGLGAAGSVAGSMGAMLLALF